MRTISVTEFVNPAENPLRYATPEELTPAEGSIKFIDRIVFYPGESAAHPEGAWFDYPAIFHPATGVVAFDINGDSPGAITLPPGSREYTMLNLILTVKDLKPGVNETEDGVRIHFGAKLDFTQH